LTDANEETSVISANALAVPEGVENCGQAGVDTPNAHVNFDTKLLYGSQLRCIDPPALGRRDSVAAGFAEPSRE
jgi:hypothetical protein